MSRLITNEYTDKLEKLINEFEQSTKLTSLINFFVDEIKKDQNRKGNKKIFSIKDFKKLNEIIDSYNLKRIFAYINIIIKSYKGKYLRIHLNVDLSENLIDNLITLTAWDAISEGLYDDSIIDEQIKTLKLKTALPLEATNNNGHSLNQLYRERYGLQHKLKLIDKIKSLKNTIPQSGMLLNLNKTAGNSVCLSEFSLFPESLNTLINFGNSLQYIYNNNTSILQNIGTIINLLPAERGKNIWHSDFVSENINRWNELPEFNFSKVITITSGEKTTESLLEMYKQKKFQAEEIYTVFPFEIH